MAFTLERADAAKVLGISTRTIDRHIQSGKIRTKKIGKKIWLDADDVEAMRVEDPARAREDYVLITKDEPSNTTQEEPSKELFVKKKENTSIELLRLYEAAERTIEKKDEVIQDLSYRLGKSENELKNSISLTEYKKATFLLESALQRNEADTSVYGTKISTLETDMNKKNGIILGLAILTSLILIFSVIFFFYLRL